MTSVLYIWAICLRMICMSGMPSSPLPFAGVGLEMLSFALGLDLFHAAKAGEGEGAEAVFCLEQAIGITGHLHDIFSGIEDVDGRAAVLPVDVVRPALLHAG